MYLLKKQSVCSPQTAYLKSPSQISDLYIEENVFSIHFSWKQHFISKGILTMMKMVFDLKRKFIGATMEQKHDQRAFDFVLVGARKVCIVENYVPSKWFHKFFDVYVAYPSGAERREKKERDEIYKGRIPNVIVRKGTNMEHVFYELDGDLYYRHEEIGVMLGFPPEECAKFNEIQDRIGVDYYGLCFACERSRLQQSLEYLEKTFSLPEWMKVDQIIVTRLV